MTLKARLIWYLAVGMLTTATFAQDVDDSDEEARPKRATKIPTEGFWPTQKMMERIINRITDQMAERYDFDDNQLELTRDLFKARFPEFLNQNRAEIQTLVNQYFEALLDEGPPAVEHVAEWAQHVQPLLAEFGEVCDEVTESMREYLTDSQTTTLDAEVAAFQTGMTMARNKLAVWADGGYDPETEWIHSGSSRRERERADEATAEPEPSEADEAQPAGSAPAKTAKGEWTIYTEKFIKRYQLNDEQKQKAFAFLRRQQEQRDDYLRRRADEMERVTELLKEAEKEAERTAALEAYSRLNAPVDRMFQRLKERLDTLPTRAQRRAAAEAGLEPERKDRPKATQPAPTKEELEELEKRDYVQPPATQPSEPP